MLLPHGSTINHRNQPVGSPSFGKQSNAMYAASLDQTGSSMNVYHLPLDEVDRHHTGDDTKQIGRGIYYQVAVNT